jgi:hypothetical protein
VKVIQAAPPLAVPSADRADNYRFDVRAAAFLPLEDPPAAERTLRRMRPTWDARFFSTTPRQTTRQGHFGFGQFFKRANCLRRSRTKALSLSNSASSSVASSGLLFIGMNLRAYNSLFCATCHSIR